MKHDAAGNKGRLGTKAQPAKERKEKLEAAGRQCSAGFPISSQASNALVADGTGKGEVESGRLSVLCRLSNIRPGQ